MGPVFVRGKGDAPLWSSSMTMSSVYSRMQVSSSARSQLVLTRVGCGRRLLTHRDRAAFSRPSDEWSRLSCSSISSGTGTPPSDSIMSKMAGRLSSRSVFCRRHRAFTGTRGRCRRGAVHHDHRLRAEDRFPTGPHRLFEAGHHGGLVIIDDGGRLRQRPSGAAQIGKQAKSDTGTCRAAVGHVEGGTPRPRRQHHGAATGHVVPWRPAVRMRPERTRTRQASLTVVDSVQLRPRPQRRHRRGAVRRPRSAGLRWSPPRARCAVGSHRRACASRPPAYRRSRDREQRAADDEPRANSP